MSARVYTAGIMTFPDFYDKVGAVKKTGHGMSGKEKRCSQLSIGYILRAKVI